MITSRIRVAVLSVVAASGATRGALAGGVTTEPALTTRYDSRDRALTADPARLAVLTPSRDAAENVAMGLGLPPQNVSAMGYPGVWLIDTTPSQELGRLEPGARVDAARRVAEEGVFVSPVFVGERGAPVIPTGRVLARVRASEAHKLDDADRLREALRVAGVSGLRGRAAEPEPIGGLPRAFIVDLGVSDGVETVRAAARLAAQPGVSVAEAEMIFGGGGLGDPALDNAWAWGIQNTGQSILGVFGTPGMDLNVLPAWALVTGDGVQVAVLDSGVDPNHPDINQLPGTDVTTDPGAGGGAPVNPCDNHGTPVAGCVASIWNNGLGSAGSAPRAVVRSVRTFISNGSCDGSWSSGTTETVNALLWAQAQGIRVTNNSNWYGFTSDLIRVSYRDTRDAGMIHFASAGNDGQNGSTYPASLASVNSVAALTNEGTRAGFSNFGPSIAVIAPGQSVYTPDRTGSSGWLFGDYTWASGTSFASPYAAGVAALILEANPALSSAEARQVLISSTRDLGDPGRDDQFGFGLLDAFGAVRAARLAACPVDLNADGFADNGDIGAFVSLFLAGDLTADFNADGFLDNGDISSFVAAFLGGCG